MRVFIIFRSVFVCSLASAHTMLNGKKYVNSIRQPCKRKYKMKSTESYQKCLCILSKCSHKFSYLEKSLSTVDASGISARISHGKT